MKQKKLFNPNGDDSISQRRIIKGDSTNLFNLNNIKYKWSKDLYRVMMSNFWIPEKVSLSEDKIEYLSLSENEKDTIKSILSFLTFLDSIQTNNIPNIKNYITAPEIGSLLSIQEYQEVVHSQSYSYILESIIPAEERNDVYELWRKNEVLLNRNTYIANLYQNFIDTPSDANFADVIIANYVLESLYFYNGFIFFYNLASKNKLVGVSQEITYINRDELTHVSLFQNIINEIRSENPNLFSEERVIEIFTEGAKQEINWSNHILGNILGMSKKRSEMYVKHLSNLRCSQIGFGKVFHEETNNPYKHLELVGNADGENRKSNFFETTVTEYSNSAALEGWDEI